MSLKYSSCVSDRASCWRQPYGAVAFAKFVTVQVPQKWMICHATKWAASVPCAANCRMPTLIVNWTHSRASSWQVLYSMAAVGWWQGGSVPLTHKLLSLKVLVLALLVLVLALVLKELVLVLVLVLLQLVSTTTLVGYYKNTLVSSLRTQRIYGLQNNVLRQSSDTFLQFKK